jgi:hypothetical protein
MLSQSTNHNTFNSLPITMFKRLINHHPPPPSTSPPPVMERASSNNGADVDDRISTNNKKSNNNKHWWSTKKSNTTTTATNKNNKPFVSFSFALPRRRSTTSSSNNNKLNISSPLISTRPIATTTTTTTATTTRPTTILPTTNQNGTVTNRRQQQNKNWFIFFLVVYFMLKGTSMESLLYPVTVLFNTCFDFIKSIMWFILSIGISQAIMYAREQRSMSGSILSYCAVSAIVTRYPEIYTTVIDNIWSYIPCVTSPFYRTLIFITICVAYREWRLSQSAALVLGFRHCPSCNNAIEKNGGCDNMICRCGFHFKWSQARAVSSSFGNDRQNITSTLNSVVQWVVTTATTRTRPVKNNLDLWLERYSTPSLLREIRPRRPIWNTSNTTTTTSTTNRNNGNGSSSGVGGEECTICFDGISNHVLSCGHVMCGECCFATLRQRRACPWCATAIVEAPRILGS